MENFTLLKYLNQKGILDDEMYDALAYELNKHLYYYGDNFRHALESNKRHAFKERIKNRLRIINSVSYRRQRIKEFDETRPLIISNGYFGLDKEVSLLGYNCIAPPWITSSKNHGLYNKNLIKLTYKIKENLELGDFNYLVSLPFLSLVKEYKEKLKTFLLSSKVIGLVLANDESFFENITIKVCRELSIPTFVFLHGLPGIYNGKDGNRADYLMVWGQKIKDQFIKTGVSENKIFVSGHPYYKNLNTKKLRFGLENVLVLTKAMGWSQHCDDTVLKDRGQILLFLNQIEFALKKVGVQKVRLRPHPSENINWYLSFLDTTFFEPDTLDLKTSLNNATLVVGPTSSVFLEAIYAGVNYLVFEPMVKEKDFIGRYPVPPFDHTEPRIPIATNELGIIEIIQKKLYVDSSFLGDYLHYPFSLNFMHSLLRHRNSE